MTTRLASDAFCPSCGCLVSKCCAPILGPDDEVDDRDGHVWSMCMATGDDYAIEVEGD